MPFRFARPQLNVLQFYSLSRKLDRRIASRLYIDHKPCRSPTNPGFRLLATAAPRSSEFVAKKASLDLTFLLAALVASAASLIYLNAEEPEPNEPSPAAANPTPTSLTRVCLPGSENYKIYTTADGGLYAVSHTGMSTEIPSGWPGNVSPEQEVKLRQLWEQLAVISGLAPSRASTSSATGTGTNGAPPAPETPQRRASTATEATGSGAKKKKRFSMFGRGKKGEEVADDAASVKSGAPAADASSGPDKHGQDKEYRKALAEMTPEQLRTSFWSFLKADDPDALCLRFLRARKWNVHDALVMMISTVHWRGQQVHLDDEIIPSGEEKMARYEKEGSGAEKTLGKDFLAQMRMGKSYVHGQDRDGRPVCSVRVRLHHGGEQSPESIERFTIYTIETARMMIRPPIETAVILFDMTNFGMANMDYAPVKFMIKVFEANYPESLGAVLVYKAPWIFNTIWAVIKGWLDPVVASKVHFVKDAKELSTYMEPHHIPKELGGDEDWEYSYIEPKEGENDTMKDTETRDKLWKERWGLIDDYEKATQDWVEGSADPDKIIERRKEISSQLRDNYWRLDPYFRARTLYDRWNVLQPGGFVQMYPDSPVVRPDGSIVGTKEGSGPAKLRGALGPPRERPVSTISVASTDGGNDEWHDAAEYHDPGVD